MNQAFVDAIGTDNIKNTKDVTFTPKDLALLKFVKLLTLNSSDTKDDDVQAMREVGWTDEQIWETSLEVGIFSLLNHMADAHGLDYPTSGWYPPALRAQLEHEKPPVEPPAKGDTPPAKDAPPSTKPSDQKDARP